MHPPRIAVIALLLLATAGCGDAQPAAQVSPVSVDTTSPAASPTPTRIERNLTKPEARFAKAVRRYPDIADDDDTDLDLVTLGRMFCQLHPDPDGIYQGFGDPISVEGIYANKDTLGPLEKNAVRYLCPEHIKKWKQAMAAFDDGDHVVGSDIKPGRYRTLERKVRDCYWERTTKGGDTIANDFVSFAPAGVTVTIPATDGGFTSKQCGIWIPA